MTAPGWQFWIDRGGTFTDIVARRPDGRLSTAKLLSEAPERYADAAAEGVRQILAGEPQATIDAIKMGTTVATNALLERGGAATALLVTRGFADVLEIGYQERPDIFALNIEKPKPLYERVVEIDERVTAKGDVSIPLDLEGARAALQACAKSGVRAVAICLLHGYCYPQHERQLHDLAMSMDFEHVSTSHDVEALIKFVSRAETTLVDAYLSPVLRRYITSLRDALASIADVKRLKFMQSSGGLTDAALFRGKDSVLSGPAGGVVGMTRAACSAGLKKLVGFDMGGTSTDVAAYDGRFDRTTDSTIAGVRLTVPTLRIHTIAAGGGSILNYVDGRYQVGPASAGANPGPACYRRGGPLTVTDANVFLGRLLPQHFPRVFGKHGDQPLDRQVAERGFEKLARSVAHDYGAARDAADVATGFLTVATENMANAIRKITVERGEDVRDFSLCCFGGAGGQHACQVANVLGMRDIWIHPLAGVLSAYGMGLADVRVERQQSVNVPLERAAVAALDSKIAQLMSACERELSAQHVPTERRKLEVSLGIRVRGTDTVLYAALGDVAAIERDFAKAYERRFGVAPISGDFLIAAVRVTGSGSETHFSEPLLDAHATPQPVSHTPMYVHGHWDEVPVYERAQLGAGTCIAGPALLTETTATTVIDPGWSGTLGPTGHLLLRRESSAAAVHDLRSAERPDPVRLEVFNRLFMHIAEQMGAVLKKTAVSVNIRERLDYSCALFDADGRLVSNAPHMPVHLGSMGESVRSVIKRQRATLAAGDAVMLNSPYAGGTHLPDITVVTPWFGGGATPKFFLASRAHHADIGGVSPGSMPAHSTHIDEEGVLIDNVFLARNGELQLAAVSELLATAKYPARNVKQNLADLQAQLAANRQGARQLDKAIERYGADTVTRYLAHVRENAAASVRRLIGTLTDGRFEYALDNGEIIRVSVTVNAPAKRASIDFSGTSAQGEHNFNAPAAVTRAAVLYVFRSLIREDIPLNEGCLEPLDVHIPAGSLLSPSYPAAVVAGNVETSQCVTDALYGALGALAASQGTMNNLSFGNDAFQYYETIAGGAGAGPGWHGADAVQTHMTNSRLTDPEVLELNLPVRVETFAVRRGSGGRGRWRGGNGALRRLRFLEPVEAAVLANHRRVAPFGLAGGHAGQTGRTLILRSDGTREDVGSTAALRLEADDALQIETPGGGGYGEYDGQEGKRE